jgi:proline racemase
MGEQLAYAEKHLGWLPGFALCEPRGHKDLFGAVLTHPCHPQADFGVIFMDNQKFEPMCGHAVIGTVTSLLGTGMCSLREPKTSVNLDTPAGLVEACATVRDGRVEDVYFDGVSSFLYREKALVRIPNGKTYSIDVAFGGNFFALVEIGQTGLELVSANIPRITELGMQILESANQQIEVCHPEFPYIDRIIDLRFYQTLSGNPSTSRNCVVLGNRMIDRSPCGTGTSAELAMRFNHKEISPGQTFTCESILGTRFQARVVAQTTVRDSFNKYPAVIVRVSGRAFLTGFNQLLLQSEDPFPQGFIL